MLSGRLTLVRQHLGLNRTEMARKLDISGPAWYHYETGMNVPGGNVLASLARLGFDLHWLLLGEGDMLRATAVPSVKPKAPAAPPPIAPWNGESCVTDILRAAKLTQTEFEYAVYSALGDAFPNSLARKDLVAYLKQTEDFEGEDYLDSALTVLQMRGLIKRSLSARDSYETCSSGEILIAKDIAGHAGVFKVALKSIARDVYPNLGTPKGKLLEFRVPVVANEAPRMLEQIREYAIKMCESMFRVRGEDRAIVVLGLGVREARKNAIDSIQVSA